MWFIFLVYTNFNISRTFSHYLHVITVNGMKNQWTFSFGCLCTGKIFMFCNILVFWNHDSCVDSWQKMRNFSNLSQKLSCSEFSFHVNIHMCAEPFSGMWLLGDECFYECIFTSLFFRIHAPFCEIMKNRFVQKISYKQTSISCMHWSFSV